MEKKYIHEEKVHNVVAAEIVVPLIIDKLQPKSVLDIGCGIGTWLNVFARSGVSIMGVDGDYVNKSLLKKYIDLQFFKEADLSKPFNLEQRYDLCISLEVAEHLPEYAADTFVESLVRHSDNVVFSAAIPLQGGQNHLNEQWPHYWIAKFDSYGYKAYDFLRPQIWNKSEIDPWYRQNILLFSKNNYSIPSPLVPDIVLPDYWYIANRAIDNLEYRMNRIKMGKVGMSFYIKGMIKSLRYFGLKQ